MKVLILALSFILTSICMGQKLIIHVYEKQEMVSYRKTTLDSVFLNPDFVYTVDTSHTKYILDLNEKTSSYSLEDVDLSILPIEFEKFGDGYIKVNILENGFDYGLIIDTHNETVLWYWNTDYSTTVKKISKCYFEKTS